MRFYIASMYTLGNQAANVRAQMDAFDALLKMGHEPFAPLMAHFIEITHPQGYEDWLRVDLAWLRVTEAVLRLPGESSGADREVELARQLGLPVYNSVEEVREATERDRK